MYPITGPVRRLWWNITKSLCVTRERRREALESGPLLSGADWCDVVGIVRKISRVTNRLAFSGSFHLVSNNNSSPHELLFFFFQSDRRVSPPRRQILVWKRTNDASSSPILFQSFAYQSILHSIGMYSLIPREKKVATWCLISSPWRMDDSDRTQQLEWSKNTKILFFLTGP